MTRIALLFVLLSTLSPSSLHAQMAEASVFIGLARLSDRSLGEVGFAQVPLELEHGVRTGARLTLNSGPLLGHELSYAYERHDMKVAGEQESTATSQEFFYDFIAHLTPKKVVIRPFFAVGVGLVAFSPGDQGIFQNAGGLTKPGVNYGGGLKLKTSKYTALRFDIRDRITAKPDFLDLEGASGRLHSVELSGGFSLLF